MGLHHSPRIVTDGLILCLDAANPKSYPGTGTTWYDLSGYNNTTTVNNGSFNSAGYFESVGDAPSALQFTTPDSTSIDSALTVTTGGWTIEELVLVDDTTYPESTAGTTFGTTVYGAGSIGIDWSHGSASVTSLNMTVNDATTLIRQNVTLASAQAQFDKWMHRAFVYNRTAGDVDVYCDGVYQDTLDISTVTGVIYDGYGIVWGALYGWKHDGFRASMKIYNKTLTTEEVKQNFNATRGRYGI